MAAMMATFISSLIPSSAVVSTAGSGDVSQERDNETYKRIEKAFGNGNSLNDLIGALCE